MSFLSKLSEWKKAKPVAVSGKLSGTATPSSSEPHSDVSYLPDNYVRDEDPAVRRLKELRRKERLKSGPTGTAVKRKRRAPGAPDEPRKRRNGADSEGGLLGTVYKRRPGSRQQQAATHAGAATKRDAVKKMTFEELMMQAETNAVEKPATTAPPQRTAAPVRNPGFKPRRRRTGPASTTKTPAEPSKPTQRRPATPRFPAQPNDLLRRRLKQREQREQRQQQQQQHRGATAATTPRRTLSWTTSSRTTTRTTRAAAAVARGTGTTATRSGPCSAAAGADATSTSRGRLAEGDDDDMEANEMEILEEEQRAARLARLEDKREEQWLRAHDASKRRRRG
ncbi:Spt2p KNAG_0G01760 [Huiozyma naganishii CBS 8797]|uniref:Uncharacterized protein n=1 Tax=Huiozyma naganishii (strain ATCC MYA-139 / BCRC 22969 / CBS 8797 / KCTC 17520 / NBRC 10181 / NCYC 3082 / Yp74L-3) TaxID=1071383 RepID=J7S7X7_HUIN7|nr:hypothetical protein KNAG_0G01760 [Kazachstania naganishii CBS 8797]CCK71234.1 hypothetical protein KNAG_0G01760 [Kazachstania naganishii CBS 8797]